MESESKAFDAWLAESVAMPSDQRTQRLVEWARAPAARACHPREEHLLPLMVAAGAAESEPAELALQMSLAGTHVSAVHFGV